MGKRGPKPTPTAIKRTRGTHRADRDPAGDEPVPSKAPPRKIPESVLLNPSALKCWRSTTAKLKAMGLLSGTDTLALENLCLAQATAEQAEKDLRAHGSLTTVGGHGGLIAHPCVNIARTSRAQVHRLLAEFGLTPASRTRVRGDSGNNNDSKKKDPADFLFGPNVPGKVVGAIGR